MRPYTQGSDPAGPDKRHACAPLKAVDLPARYAIKIVVD